MKVSDGPSLWRAMTVGAGLVAVAMVSGFGMLALRPPDQVPMPEVHPAAAAQQEDGGPLPIDPRAWTAVLWRPLRDPPPPVPVPPPPAPAPPPIRVQLLGLATHAGGSVAVLDPQDGQGLLQLAPGRSERGISLERIDGDAVELRVNDRSVRLELPRSESKGLPGQNELAPAETGGE